MLEPVDVLDDSHNVKPQFIDAFRKMRPEPAFVVPYLEMDLRLCFDQRSDLLIHEKRTQLRIVVSLDDERFIELRETDLDISHSEEFCHRCKEALTVDRKSKTVGIRVRCSHAGEDD